MFILEVSGWWCSLLIKHSPTKLQTTTSATNIIGRYYLRKLDWTARCCTGVLNEVATEGIRQKGAFKGATFSFWKLHSSLFFYIFAD